MINFPLILVSLCFIGTIIWLIYKIFFSTRDDFIIENVRAFLPILWVVLILRSFIVEPFQIPSGSMLPTLKVGDFILVNKFSYGLRLPVLRTKVVDISEPKRGDVMVFFPPHEDRYFIKRVVGVPGDKIKYVNKQLTVNGEPAQYESFERGLESMEGVEELQGVKHAIKIHNNLDPRRVLDQAFELEKGVTVKPGHYYVMGDNRDRSEDSRGWGQVPESRIVGKAFFVWLHWPKLDKLPSFSTVRTIE